MRGFVGRLLGSAAGLYLASELFVGLSIDGAPALVVSAVLLGVINAVVRPVFVFLTFPVTLATLGLFLLVVNAAMLGLAAFFVRGFAIDGFAAALLGSIVVSAGTSVGGWLARDAD